MKAFKKHIRHQRKLNYERIKRARTLAKLTGTLSHEELEAAAAKGRAVVAAMKKDDIIDRYVDHLDLVFAGLFGE